jgi:hypothetical protein
MNSFKPPPARAGGSEESTLLSTVATVGAGILLTVIQVFSVVYEFYFWAGLFLEGPS